MYTYTIPPWTLVGRGGRDLRRSGNIVQGESRAEGRSVKVSRRGQSREKRMNGHRVEVYIYGRRVHILSNCGVRLYYYLKYYTRCVNSRPL
jgi:predicted acyltransferase (DUF342 family)